MSEKRNRERMVWAVITVVLLTALVLFVFSPRLLAANPETETQVYLQDIADVFRYVRDNYVNESKAMPKALVEGALKGMLSALEDPYSEYYAEEDTSQLDDTTMGKYSGVGLIISKVEDGAEIVAPIEGSPAYKAGINAGDVVTRVNGEPMAELTINDIMKKIRGETNTEVTLSIRRGESVVFDLTVKRELIEVPAVKYAMIGQDIGYLRIIQFTSLSPDRCREALLSFKANKAKYIVVDLRGNPGGTLASPIEIANFFIPSGVIVGARSERQGASPPQVYTAKERNMIVDQKIPVVVLVDKGSASASEILAGALKDTGRAVLIGTTTYGKGSVQEVHRIPDTGGEFKLTVALYYTPSGEFIDKKGVVPHKVIEEDKLTAEQEKGLTDLLNGKYVQSFVKSNPQPTEVQVRNFITDMAKKNIVLDERYLRRLVRTEVNRTNNYPPIYDLDFDIVLQTAVKALRGGEIKGK
jgi:carboxyl-terminal processing protease